ncbi:unnamed protein product [Alternaria alternata]
MTDKSRESLDPAARPPAQDHRPRNNPDEHDPGRVRRHETPIGGDRVHDTEEDAAHSVASDVTPSELDMRVQSHWGIVKPASANVVRNIVRGSLITAPVIQFGKDRDGRRKRERGFYKSPLGMILIKRYPLVVYDVDLDERHLPKRLHCMQRHTYGGSGLRRGARLREDYHLHVKLVPPGRDKNDRGDAPNEPLIIERMYNSKKISENSYLEFRSICTVELDEYVVLDGHLEMDSWVRLFGLYMSTVSRTATQQLQKTPEFRRQIRDVFDDLTGDLDENEQRVAGAVSTDLIQRATSNNASLQSQQFPELPKIIISRPARVTSLATTGKTRKCDIHEGAQRRRHDVDVVDLHMEWSRSDIVIEMMRLSTLRNHGMIETGLKVTMRDAKKEDGQIVATLRIVIPYASRGPDVRFVNLTMILGPTANMTGGAEGAKVVMTT